MSWYINNVVNTPKLETECERDLLETKIKIGRAHV